MATSSFTTLFKIPKKVLQEIANSKNDTISKFKLSKKDKESLATIGGRFQKWVESNKS